MSFSKLRVAALLGVGFVAGAATAHLPTALARSTGPGEDLSKQKFWVSINEVKQNFVFGDEFTGVYEKEVVLSDGKTRSITLTPMLHEGKQVVELRDTGGRTYMGLNGTTTNGKLMVQLVEVDGAREALRSQGWRLAE